MIPQQLRLESAHGFPTKEYRLSHGKVEVRRLDSDNPYTPESMWRRLTPQQLSDHVRRSDVVSKWLQQRIGWRRLLQMCVGEESTGWTATHAPAPEELHAP
jgi:hypothetical protein